MATSYKEVKENRSMIGAVLAIVVFALMLMAAQNAEATGVDAQTWSGGSHNQWQHTRDYEQLKQLLHEKLEGFEGFDPKQFDWNEIDWEELKQWKQSQFEDAEWKKFLHQGMNKWNKDGHDDWNGDWSDYWDKDWGDHWNKKWGNGHGGGKWKCLDDFDYEDIHNYSGFGYDHDEDFSRCKKRLKKWKKKWKPHHGGPNPVPVPAAVWLFGSALVGLAGWRRKQKLSGGVAK